MIFAIGSMIAVYALIRLIEILFKNYKAWGGMMSILAVIGMILIVFFWYLMLDAGTSNPTPSF